MKQESVCEDEFVVNEGPVVSSVSARAKNRYGSVPGLDDDELTDPCELERQVMMQEWGPVLELPVRGRKLSVYAAVDDNGGVGWDAFAIVDFDRNGRKRKLRRSQNRMRMRREELRNTFILLSIVKERLPAAKSEVLKYVEKGVIQLDQIENEDMRALARLHVRARRLDAEIRRSQEASRRRLQKRFAELLA